MLTQHTIPAQLDAIMQHEYSQWFTAEDDLWHLRTEGGTSAQIDAARFTAARARSAFEHARTAYEQATGATGR